MNQKRVIVDSTFYSYKPLHWMRLFLIDFSQAVAQWHSGKVSDW